MPITARQARGRRSQKVLATYFRKWWPGAESVEGASRGRDIKGMPGLAVEVKATSDGSTNLLAALRQAKRNAGDDLSFVVWRPNGFGEERVPEWVAVFTLSDATGLLLDAGYGDDPDSP